MDTAPDQAPAEPAPSQTLYVHNLAERPRKDGAFVLYLRSLAAASPYPNPRHLVRALADAARRDLAMTQR